MVVVVVAVVAVVVGVVGPGMIGGGIYHHPRCLLLPLLFPHMRNSHLLLN